MGIRGREFYEKELSAIIGFNKTEAVLNAAGSMRKKGLVLKRVVDVAVGSIALILLSPVMLGVAAIIRGTCGAPVLFRQTRSGLDGRPFVLYKFRTMKESRDANGVLLSDKDRLFPAGQILRRLSLDELPQLWNILRGDMNSWGRGLCQ